ncbi:MAG: glycerol-3-phosphate dehydrogenase [Rickettsiales bacterium]|nr:glycerol-3-phosphate dehydrogenase [Rickettsiales bacterium]|tara:strand:+ start:293 stop:1297 length:1005 start_codon:yes stop_codon:yes gene_type:complete
MVAKVAVLGAGSFGTALSAVLLRGGNEVSLWCYEPGHADEVNAQGRNSRYMTEFELPGLRATARLDEAVDGASMVLFVSPSHVTRALARDVRDFLSPGTLLVCASKGIEAGGETMDEVLRAELPAHCHEELAFISGPSFAREVLEGQPTAVVVASRRLEVAERVQKAFSGPSFRVYTTGDVVGVELGGAVKNIIAIAAGCGDGLGFGHNVRAAVITRGLAEMSRLGAAKGADPLTFMGLAGMGDLVLTCTGDLSRNRRVGLGLGKGMTLAEVTESLGGQVAEGVKTTASTYKLAQRIGLDMPLVTAMHELLYDGRPARELALSLMERPLKHELD